MFNVQPNPSNFKVYFDTVQNLYVTNTTRWNMQYILKDPIRYKEMDNFSFEDEISLTNLNSRGGYLQNRIGHKFEMKYRDLNKMIDAANNGKFVDPVTNTIMFRGKFTFVRRGTKTFLSQK